jgi:hypothetical protein
MISTVPLGHRANCSSRPSHKDSDETVATAGLLQIEAICIHHLGERSGEVAGELLARVVC